MSQLVTAKRCRMMPLPACTSPTPNSSAAHSSSAEVSRAATPRSIARPMIAGITAWALIHTTPNSMPMTRVRHCWRAIHHKNLPGDRWSGVPGWSRGRWRTVPRYG